MDGNRMMQQVSAIFSIFMVIFYLTAGVYLVFFYDMSTLDKAVLVIFGSTFILLGLYRGFRAYTKIVEVFFTKEDDDK